MRILSLGAGVQSSTMALMAAQGEIDPPDCAIFADTGWEPAHVYEWLNWLKQQLPFPVHIVSKGNLRDDLIFKIEKGVRFASVPFYTETGIGKRQCTNEYKIQPINQKVRELIGLKHRQRKTDASVQMLIGISTDEIVRIKPNRVAYITNLYPLIDKRMSRNDCLQWMNKHGYPMPPKSSCIGCPFHSNQHWREMRDNDPVAWAEACAIDDMLRSESRVKTKMKQREYMHRSLSPLRTTQLGDEWTVDMFGNECEGMCGV